MNIGFNWLEIIKHDKSRPTQRAPDGWESPRFQAVCVAQAWFRYNGVTSSRPPAGNARRWAVKQETMLIDLRKSQGSLIAEIGKSLIDFSVQHPEVKVCTVGLAGDGFHGRAALFLDTPERSAAHVKEYLSFGRDWYGEDKDGRFCKSCADFSYCIGEYNLPDYPDFYKVAPEELIEYITLSGAKEQVKVDEGDEGLNRVVFPFLKTTLMHFQPFAQLRKSIPFRVGVQMHDSQYKEFWNLSAEIESE